MQAALAPSEQDRVSGGRQQLPSGGTAQEHPARAFCRLPNHPALTGCCWESGLEPFPHSRRGGLVQLV